MTTHDAADKDAERLFVYGTLAPGRPNAHVLAETDGVWEPATITGKLLEQGWGAALGYPVLVLDQHGDEIAGFLFTSGELPARWQELDEFEGVEYERVSAPVVTEDGTQVAAQVYVHRRSDAGPGRGLDREQDGIACEKR